MTISWTLPNNASGFAIYDWEHQEWVESTSAHHYLHGRPPFPNEVEWSLEALKGGDVVPLFAIHQGGYEAFTDKPFNQRTYQEFKEVDLQGFPKVFWTLLAFKRVLRFYAENAHGALKERALVIQFDLNKGIR